MHTGNEFQFCSVNIVFAGIEDDFRTDVHCQHPAKNKSCFFFLALQFASTHIPLTLGSQQYAAG